MFRWLFLVLVLANVVPFFVGGNSSQAESGFLSSRVPGSEVGGSPGGKITLLSEQRAEVRPVLSESEKAVPQRREARCFLLGPLPSISMAENYAKQLESSGLEVERHWREITVGEDYWVYLPRLPSSRATTRTLQELKANKIDGVIFSEGELRGAIALGVYTDESLAEAKKKEFAELGYEPKLHKMGRKAREFWLMGEELPRPGIMQELAKSQGLSKIPQKISRMDCKTVASAMQFQ